MAKRLLLDYHKSLPLIGLQASTVLLLIYGFTCVCSNEVLVPERVSAVLGKNITLGCRVEVGTNLSLTQSSWERRLPSGTITLAVFNPQFGISISPDYARRLSFLNPSVHDATIVLEGVGFQDIGSYTCKVATFPLGNTQASTTVNILVEPKVYVSAGSTALVDGGNESVAATCIAERGRPAAEVSWETELFGRSEVQTQDEPNGTSTTQVRYVLEPRRHSQGHTLTCVVRHPALQTEFRIPYVLNVQFAPEVTVVGYDQNWFVGQDNVKLDCGAKANPPAHHFSWTRLDGPMPDGVDIVNNTFTFTRPLERNDSGLYRCEVSNDIGPRGQDVHVWIQDMEEDMEIDRNVTGILGEDVFLRCQYMGPNDITEASWKRPDSRMKRSMKKLTGYKNNKAFSKDPDFSAPASPTNLTVKMRVSTLEAQGEYTCVFATDEEEITNSMFLTVLARPDIYTVVTEDTDNATHYQSVTCSATNGKPVALIRWEINGSPPTDDSSVEMRNTSYTNGTATMTSLLRFPTHLQDQDRVTCVVQHPTLPDPTTRVTVRVETFVAPNMTIETYLVLEEGEKFWVVACGAAGGRPRADITLVLPNQEVSSMLQKEVVMDAADTWVRSYRFPAELHEGENITCLFDHPKFPHGELRTITLPAFSLSAVRLQNPGLADSSNKSQAVESVVLEEGQSKTTIGLEVVGDVPRYSIVCTKEEQSLPEGVAVFGSALTLQGPVELYHAGLYECEASYFSHRASVLLDITVNPHVKQPVTVPPSIRIDVQDRLGDRFIECLAADSVPVANVSWVLPEGVSGPSWSSLTSHNGTYSVSSVLVLPACSAQELNMECVIDHTVFVLPERRQITLPVCAPPNITIQSSSEWEEDVAYTLVQCTVDNVGPAATISWSLGDWDSDNSTSQLMEVQGQQVHRQPELHANGSVTVRSVLRFPTSMFSGQNVTCVVDHLGLEKPERTGILLRGLESPVMRVFVGRQRGSLLWLAVCEYRGDRLGAHLSWVLPDNATGHISFRSGYEGVRVLTNLTYEFSLALHEGQDLTCLIQNHHGLKERRTVHVPKYYISSVRVLNQTTPLYKPYGDESVIHRMSLKENFHNQRILLKVYGSVPTYSLTCQRNDGTLVQMDGRALLFHSEVTEQEAGLYTCQASFYHHQASVLIQVEVTSEDKQLMIVFIVCFSSAAAITILLIVTLCVFCKINGGDRLTSKKRESLAPLTSLTQELCSPELRKGKTAVTVSGGRGQEYNQPLSYSIVIDARSTV
ncbi:uncharacterized protein LOC115136772 isoform X3 [Oncorhynchus nerka]|uniref:uncharacterized protein LOC115136772 isoform X3 n=1 Tax=Oncorhynchus nerka TaxID=8023 RepID=UPI0031B88C4E